MILTLTLNPSVDISYAIEDFQLDTVNRVSNIDKTAGGKGLNVTRVLNQLNESVIASGLIGGQLGEFIEQQLEDSHIKHSFSKLKMLLEIVLLFYIKVSKRKFWKKGQLLVKKKDKTS